MSAKHLLHNHHLAGDTFLWPGGPAGVLLSHGYTATTAEVRPLAEKLHRQGYTVAGPLLPGHGVTPAAMNRCRWQDWAAALEETYHTLKARCEHVFVGGESMGGVLALYVASQQPDIAGILAYAPAMQIPRRPLVLSYLARPFLRHAAKRSPERLNGRWQGYLVNPIPALHQLHRLQREVWLRLPAIRQPLLIVQGRQDRDIDLHGVVRLYREVGSRVKELHWMERSGHVVILDKELPQVGQITLGFMERVLARRELEIGE